MRTHGLRSLTLGVAACLLAAALTAQTRAFDKYVALGDSLTAGFESGCLVERNQVNSYPAVLARTFGITDFQQPLVEEIALTSPLVGNPCLGAVFLPPSTITVGPVSQMGPPLNAALPRPYDNLGMPGANVADLTELTHGDVNGSSIERIAALVLRNVTGSPFDGTSAVQQADILLAGSTGSKLVSLWIGNNDVLGAATSGIVIDGVTLTTAADFTASYQAILDALFPGVSVIRANIPDVTAIPFATTIPPVLVDPSTRQPVLIGGLPVPLLGEGDDSFPCTPVAPDQGCPLPTGTLVTLPASAILAQGTGIPVAAGGNGLPLPHGHLMDPGILVPGVTLYPDEVALLQQRTDEYNAAIAAATGGGVLVDIHSFFNDVRANGFSVGGITLTTSFLTGGVFSYDGVHPSSTGYMIVADRFVQALNEANGTDIPRPNFASILFTPNVPSPGLVPAGDGGIWGYGLETWRSVLSSTLPESVSFVLRSPLPTSRPHRSTRRVVRASGG